MAATPTGTDPAPKADPGPPEMGHPRGTLTLVALYGLLLALGWLTMYFAFLGRGAPHP